MLRIKNYMKKFEEEKSKLDDEVNTHGITPEMVIDSLTPGEKKIVDMLGGEAMIYGLVRGNVEIDECGNVGIIEPDSVRNEAIGE